MQNHLFMTTMHMRHVEFYICVKYNLNKGRSLRRPHA